MKVIFLDIDGVLNSTRSFIANHPRFGQNPWKTVDERNIATIDPIAVKLVNEVAHRCDAEIVVSSTHRKWFFVQTQTMQLGRHLDLPQLVEYMHNLGIEKDVIDATPILSSEGRVRGDEIALWLSKNPQVEKYVILDDDSDMLDNQLNNFVHTDNFNGFSFYDFKQAVLILGAKNEDENLSLTVPVRE